jgi:prepilin-type N-terminal cleavage/methylation domain-containing protein
MTKRTKGFTLVELIAAVTIMGSIFLILLELQINAVEKVTVTLHERELRRVAQELLEEKIAEFLIDEVQQPSGEIEGRPGWRWEWFDPLLPENVIEENGEFLVACTVCLYYPANPNEPDGEEQTYELTSWILPTEDMLQFLVEQRELMLEEGELGGGVYDYGY